MYTANRPTLLIARSLEKKKIRYNKTIVTLTSYLMVALTSCYNTHPLCDQDCMIGFIDQYLEALVELVPIKRRVSREKLGTSSVSYSDSINLRKSRVYTFYCHYTWDLF